MWVRAVAKVLSLLGVYATIVFIALAAHVVARRPKRPLD
jgi:hypothetical protein